MRLVVIAIGRLKQGPERELAERYRKRAADFGRQVGLQAFDIIKIMTPTGNGTGTLIFEAYLQAFGAYNRAGYSAAISVVLFVLLLIMTGLQLRFVERKVHYA